MPLRHRLFFGRGANADEKPMKSRQLGLVFIAVAMVGFAQTPPENLKSKLNENRGKKRRLAQELAKTKRKIGVVVGDIKWVDDRLDQLESELESTTQSLTKNRSRQVQLNADLKETTIRLGEVKSQVRARLRKMYVHGPTSFLSVVVGTKNVGDLISRKNLQDSIAKEDHRVFGAYRSLQKKVAEQKHKQDALVVRIAQDERRQKSQQEDLEDARSEKTELLSGLKDQKAKQEEMLRQFEQDERSIEAQIRAYMQRVRSAKPGSPNFVPVFKGRLSKPINAHMTSGFGMRYHPVLHYTRIHAGCDFGASTGTPINAAGDGVVISTAYMRGYGNTVIIDHGGGLQTVYAHTSRIFVHSGQAVKRGQHIAAVGSTGLATGPHLHFEVHVNGHAVNPLGKL